MSEFAGKNSANNPLLNITSHICKFETPTSTKLVFEDIFLGPFNEKATDVLQVATKQRDALMGSLTYGGSTPDPRAIVASCKEYYPTVWCITESMVHAGDTKLTMKKKLKFSWSSVLDRRERRSHWVKDAFVFEIAQVLVLQALQSSNAASNLCAADDYSAAAQQLREAAGILVYVAETLLPKWTSMTPDVPFEVEGSVLKAIAKVMQAQAQQMAISKALSMGKKLPSTLLAKLCMGCISFYNEGASLLRSLPKAKFDMLDTVLLEVCGVYPKILKGYAFQLMAKDYYEKGTYGYAAAYAEEALNVFSQLVKLQNKPLHPIQKSVDALQSDARNLADTYIEENNTVYFEPLPDEGVTAVPAKTMDVSVKEYKTPPVSYISLAQIAETVTETTSTTGSSKSSEPKKSGGGWFSALTGGSKKSSKIKKVETKEEKEKIASLVAMGFDEDKAKEILPKVDYDVSRAVDELAEAGAFSGSTTEPPLKKKPAVDPKEQELQTKVEMCVGMGFDAAQAREVLPTVDYDVSRAIDKLVLSGGGDSSSSSKNNSSGRMLGNNDNHYSNNNGYGSSKTGGDDDEDVLEIVVPEGVRSGQTISIKDPRNGKIYRVCVPLGAGPGTKIQVNTS